MECAKKLALQNKIVSRKGAVFVGPLLQDNSELMDLGSFPKIAIDGGRFIQPESFWDWSLGDDDSQAVDRKFPQPLKEKYPSNKDQSDLSLALTLIPENEKYLTLILIGLKGGLLDFELANLGDIFTFLQFHPSCKVIWKEKGKNTLIASSYSQQDFTIHQRFSLFSLEKMTLSMEGQCQYPAKNLELTQPLSSKTLSNIGFGKVNISSETPYFIIGEDIQC